MGWTEYNNLSRPGWIADHGSESREPGGRQIDWSQVSDAYRGGTTTNYTITVTEPADAAATALTVAALPVALPSGTVLNFAGAGEFAMLTAAAEEGATSLTVEALDAAIEDNDTATYTVVTAPTETYKSIKSGTVMAALTSGKIVPRAIRPGSETAIGLLIGDANEGERSHAASGYGLVIGGVVYENLLPEATGDPATIDSTYKTELQAAGVGTGFAFRQYSDDTGS